ncbi:hypothetical protein NAF17_00670 [Mucilaginibacter sp. RB4R14]|uniref:hypothetical protein n=1 Tax=Mucilaginibacter aurantiaciroseus TaxID=2949308 RepID=UPI0020913BC0|nr:hypothetical protein [Mucilaginibacter aurantiaciroseus]MCO5934036.1 hypothetical protein [Mucilaginibacter aurantiaciroseus]
MFTSSFQLVIIFSIASIIVMLAVYALYCHNRARVFATKGRVTDVETWAMKSIISWIGAFFLTLAAIVPFMID